MDNIQTLSFSRLCIYYNDDILQRQNMGFTKHSVDIRRSINQFSLSCNIFNAPPMSFKRNYENWSPHDRLLFYCWYVHNAILFNRLLAYEKQASGYLMAHFRSFMRQLAGRVGKYAGSTKYTQYFRSGYCSRVSCGLCILLSLACYSHLVCVLPRYI